MFYDRLKEICDAKGTTPTTVAKAIGISTGNVSRWKNGVNPKLPILRKLSDYLEVPIEALTGEPMPEGDARVIHAKEREIFRENGVSVFLDAGNKLSKDDLDDIIEFIKFKQREIGR